MKTYKSYQKKLYILEIINNNLQIINCIDIKGLIVNYEFIDYVLEIINNNL